MSSDWRRSFNWLLANDFSDSTVALDDLVDQATIGKPQATRVMENRKATPTSEEQSTTSGQVKSDSDAHLDTPSLAAPRIFAFVVAIDAYKSPEYPNLTGCKNDGQRFIRLLTNMLDVTPQQTMFLADEEATQAKILEQFDKFLVKNEDIQRDDAIVFFFAGHGTRLDAPPGWVSENNKIEILCPHDFQTIGTDGKQLWGISDRAIDALLRQLAFEKGDNIVTVFDCCHSGCLARGCEQANKRDLRIRSIPPPCHPPPADLNREIWSSIPEPLARAAKTVVQTGSRYRAMESHVLLAACRPDELALEDPHAEEAPGGLFTTTLIECLRRCSLHDTSYTSLFEMLDIGQGIQHPQCEGVNSDRLLFSVNTHRSGETTFKVSEKTGKIYVSAGSIHGVIEGTEFAVKTPTQLLALKAKEVGAFESLLEPGRDHDITTATAKISRWHHPTLSIHSPLRHSSDHVIVVPDNKPADIALHQDEFGKWVLERCDPLIRTYSSRFIHFDANSRRLSTILDSIVNFNSYLYRSENAAASFSGKVYMRMHRLGNFRGEINPVGEDLLDVPRMSHSGVEVKEATISDFNSRYGFTLENTTEVDLFPYFFYFDPSDYSVQPWYKPPSPTMSAPLQRCKADGTPSVFAFGYGAFGTNPIELYLPPGSETDSGFLKLFLSTTYVDMTDVAQSPISELYSSRRLNYSLKGTWTCETFVLTCKQVGSQQWRSRGQRSSASSRFKLQQHIR